MRLTILIALLTLVLGCTAQVVSNPVCDQPEYADSLICEKARALGYEPEDIRDFLLDANAIALITEQYSQEDLSEALDTFESYLDDPISYALFYAKVGDDLNKVKQIQGIIERRMPLYATPELIRESDLKLIRIMIERVRESS